MRYISDTCVGCVSAAAHGRRLKAFSLPELLVVLVIIGILVLIALPNMMPLISELGICLSIYSGFCHFRHSGRPACYGARHTQ